MIKGLDVFCGAGGSSAGAAKAGISMVAAIDKCPIATATYSANFECATVLTSAAEKVKIATLKRSIGQIDVLLASPECTNHTCAKGSAPRNEQSRATAMELVRYAEGLKPRWFVMENVIQMRPW